MKPYSRKPWTDDECAILDSDYPVRGPAYVANKLGRSENSVRWKACMRGARTRGPWIGKPWRERDDRVVIQLYRKLPTEAIAERLGRPVNAIRKRAARLGVAKKGKNGRAWTADELKELMAFRGRHKLPLRYKLNRSYSSIKSAIRRAKKRGDACVTSY